MNEGDLEAVAEGIGDEKWWAFEEEFADGSVAGADEVDTEVAETVHNGVGVQVAASEAAWGRATGCRCVPSVPQVRGPRSPDQYATSGEAVDHASVAIVTGYTGHPAYQVRSYSVVLASAM